MMTLDELWENLRQNPETKATMEEVDKSYKLFKKIENLIVADLETKLAESVEIINEWMQLNIEKSKEIQQLKQQLAEKDKVIENLRIDLKDWQDLEEKLGAKYDKVVEKLAEKEKEIVKHKAETVTFTPKLVNNAELVIKIIQSDADGIDYLKQLQNQTAIAELEKVVEFIKEYPHEPRYWDIASYIDKQIKELKGEN